MLTHSFYAKALAVKRQVLNGLGISILEHQVENHFEENYELEEEDQLVCYGLYSQPHLSGGEPARDGLSGNGRGSGGGDPGGLQRQAEVKYDAGVSGRVWRLQPRRRLLRGKAGIR